MWNLSTTSRRGLQHGRRGSTRWCGILLLATVLAAGPAVAEGEPGQNGPPSGAELGIEPASTGLAAGAARREAVASFDQAAFEPSARLEPAAVAAAAMVGSADEPLAGEPPDGVTASYIYGVDVRSDEERTVVRIVGDGQFYYSTFALEDPDRFVVDLEGVVNTASVNTVAVDDERVERVRLAQYRQQPELVARVVVDLQRPVVPLIDTRGDGLTLSFADELGAEPAEPPAPVAETEAEPEAETAVETPEASPASAPAPAEALTAPLPEEPAAEMTAVAAATPPSEPEPEPTMAPGPEPEPTVEPQPEPEPMMEPEPEPATESGPESWTPPADPVQVAEAAAWQEMESSPEPQETAEPQPAPEPEDLPEPQEPVTPEPPPGEVSIRLGDEEPTDLSLVGAGGAHASFEARSIGGEEREYHGEPITIRLRDSDIKDVLRTFAQVSGLNIVVQPGVSGSVTVELEDVPWDQALEQILKVNGLGYELEGTIMRIAPISQLRAEAEEQQRLKAAQALSIPLRTIVRRISYAEAGEVADVLARGGGASVMSQRGSVVVDERTNTLIIKELPDYIDAVIAIIEQLDIPEPQVSIEARIIETTKRFSRSLGIQWGFAAVADAAHGNTTGLQFPNNADVDGGVNLLTGAENGFLDIALGNVLDTFQLDAALNVAETEGLINILSAPKITTLNNEKASIQSGLQIPIQTVANNTVSVQFVNATLRLDVTPHVTAEGTVLMDIDIQKREPQLAFAVVGATNAPIATKDARTRVIVRDGGTTVIGGIYKVTSDLGEDRVPGLASVPILGHLFRNKRRSDENEELLIFITPRVVKL